MIDCKGCGKCCSEFYNIDKWFDVELHEKDRERIPQELQEYRNGGDETIPQPYIWLKRKPNGSCICFDEITRLCTIYEIRPEICKIFDRNHSKCKNLMEKE